MLGVLRLLSKTQHTAALVHCTPAQLVSLAAPPGGSSRYGFPRPHLELAVEEGLQLLLRCIRLCSTDPSAKVHRRMQQPLPEVRLQSCQPFLRQTHEDVTLQLFCGTKPDRKILWLGKLEIHRMQECALPLGDDEMRSWKHVFWGSPGALWRRHCSWPGTVPAVHPGRLHIACSVWLQHNDNRRLAHLSGVTLSECLFSAAHRSQS